jgi:Immunoglobulin domain
MKTIHLRHSEIWKFMARVPRSCLLLAFLFLPLAVRADCVQWIQRTDVGSPGIRTGPTLAFDSLHGVTVMFGGETTNGAGGRINPTDTWEYNGTNWYPVSITGASPPGRSYQAMAFDSARGLVMLCGGQNAGGILKDTWFYASHGDGTGTWTQGPDFDTVGRTSLAMAFDSIRNVMVVMGGTSDLNGTANEPYGTLQPTTFEWNGASWSLGTPFPSLFGTGQAGIARQAMCFDANEGWVILGGGTVAAYSVSPVAPCNGPFYEVPDNLVEGYGTGLSGWSEVDSGEVTDCGGFSQSAIAYDSRRHVSVLFGGSSLTGNAPGTLEFPVVNPVSPPQGIANIWYPLYIYLPSQPPMRSRHAMAYDSRRGVTVLFGGENSSGTPLGDTWELTPDTPAIIPTAVNQQICQGGTATFSVNISGGSGPFLYQWQFNGANLTNNSRISGATNSATLTISSVTTSDAGAYVLTMVDTCGDITYGQPATLIVNYPPTITGVAPASLALCPGDSGSLSVYYTSPLPVTYQWAQNLIAIPGQTNQQLNFVAAATNQSGLYTVSVSDACGGVGSATVPVSVGVWVRTPPSPTNTATLCQPFTLSMLARGKGSLTAQWFRNGALIVPDSRITVASVLQSSGDTLLSLNFSEIKYQDDGTYTAIVTDECGPVAVGPFTLSVQPNPPWIVIATTGPAPRWDAAMAYDSDRRVSVLFGGEVSEATGPALTNDSWEFDGTNWAQRLPATSPAARSLAQMVYDSHRHRTVLFGGMTNSASGLIYGPETWEWDGTNWLKINTPHIPGFSTQPNFSYANCFDSVRNEMLVFGGVTSTGDVSQLWGYDGTDWRVKSPTGTTPSYTSLNSIMAFDTNRSVAVMYGIVQSAAGKGNIFGYSVWEWDGTVWHERPQSGQQPSFQNASAFAYDTFRQECVLYGYDLGEMNGMDTTSLYPYPDGERVVWRWNGAQWAADPPTPTPGVAFHIYHSMVFDSARNALVVFGGLQNSGGADTNFTYEILYQDDPIVLKQPAIEVSLLGQEVQLSVLAAGAPPIGYQWQKGTVNLTDGGTLSGSKTNVLTINPTAASDSGFYQVVLSNLCGMAVSQPIQLMLTTTPLSIVVSGSSLMITWTDSGAVLQSAPSLSGSWTTIPGATSPYTANTTGPMQFYRLLHP